MGFKGVKIATHHYHTHWQARVMEEQNARIENIENTQGNSKKE